MGGFVVLYDREPDGGGGRSAVLLAFPVEDGAVPDVAEPVLLVEAD
jgi:hypothetical protein